jgi:carbon monoxide dehydrogenase subunit G
MGISFEGQFEVPRKRDEVYRFLADPKQFAPLLPGYQSMEVEDEKTCSVKLKVGVPQIPGSATVKLHLDEEKPPEHALYSGKGKMTGGAMNLTAGFDLSDGGDGKTTVQWKGEVLILGRLASLAGGLLKPLAKKNIEALIGSLQEKLS